MIKNIIDKSASTDVAVKDKGTNDVGGGSHVRNSTEDSVDTSNVVEDDRNSGDTEVRPS